MKREIQHQKRSSTQKLIYSVKIKSTETCNSKKPEIERQRRRATVRRELNTLKIDNQGDKYEPLKERYTQRLVLSVNKRPGDSKKRWNVKECHVIPKRYLQRQRASCNAKRKLKPQKHQFFNMEIPLLIEDANKNDATVLQVTQFAATVLIIHVFKVQ